MSASRATAVLLAALGVLVGGGPASAAGAAGSDERPIGLGIALGYGHAMAMRDRTVGTDAAEPRLLAINPHLRIRLRDFGTPGRWSHTRLEGMLEGSVLVNFEPQRGTAAGASVVLRGRLRPDARISPYGEGGAGMTALDFDLWDQADGFNFLLLAGVGVRWQLAPGVAVTTAARYHHISNASFSVPNAGIDDVQVLLGFELR